MTRNALAARNNKAYGQGKTADSGSVQSFATIKNTGHGNFVIGRFYTRARKRPLPDRHPLSDFFSEGKERLYTGYLQRIIPSSNCPSKLKDKVRRIFHAKLKLFNFQIKMYYLSDANHQTDNPSHTNNPSLV